MSRRRIVVLTAAAGVIAAAAIVAFATMGQAGPDPEPEQAEDPQQSVVHKVTESPEDVEAYWTPERMRDAKPIPMPTEEIP